MMKQSKTIFVFLFTLLLIISLSVSSFATFDTCAAGKKYKATYNLKRNDKKTIKLKSKIKSVKSSNKNVVTVKKLGKKFTITTKKKGTAIITVKCKNKKNYRYKVKVSKQKNKHVHKYESVTIKTVQETRVVYAYFPYICRCNIGWFTYEELKAHQDSTGKDGTCRDCGTYIAQVRKVTPNGDGSYHWETLPCPTCGGRNIESNVACTGWANGSIPTPLNGTSEYCINQCSCGKTKGKIYICFYPDAEARAKHGIEDNAFYLIEE